MDIQTCPRRMREAGPWEKVEGRDSWTESPRQWDEVVPACSFCGSLHPGKFLELVARGWAVGPTDKNYKAYLNQIPQNGDEPNQSASRRYRQAKFYYQHLSDSQQVQFIDLYNRGGMILGHPGRFYVPPFFMRLGPV
jgi:hypothetical protein